MVFIYICHLLLIIGHLVQPEYHVIYMQAYMSSEITGPGFSTRSDTNQPVQSQKKVRILKFWVDLGVKEVLYYPSSENKVVDQLCSYFTADLRLCFCTGKSLVF